MYNTAPFTTMVSDILIKNLYFFYTVRFVVSICIQSGISSVVKLINFKLLKQNKIFNFKLY
jgi:hypothetical protein